MTLRLKDKPEVSGGGATEPREVPPSTADLALLLLVLLGIGLRIATLGVRPVWDDEAWTFFASSNGWRHLLDTLAMDSHPALFYLSEMLPLRLFGSSEFVLRLVPLLSGIALIGVAAGIQTRIGGRRSGILAAGLLAAAPILVYSAQEARSYSLLAVETLAGAWLLWRHAQQPSRSRGFLAFVVLALASWTHYYGTFLLVFGAAAALLQPRRNFLRAVAPVAAGFVSALALMPLIVTQKHSYAGFTFSGGGYGEDLGLIRSLARSVLAMGNAGYPEGWIRPAGHLVFVLVAAVLVVAALRDRRARSNSIFPVLLAGVLLVCWQVGGRLHLWPIRDNYLAVIAPAVLLVFVNGMLALPARSLRRVVLLALLFVMVTGDVALAWGPGGHPNPDFRKAVSLIQERRPDGVLLGRSWGDLSCYRYYDRTPRPVVLYGVPRSQPTLESRVVGVALSELEDLVPTQRRLCILSKDSGSAGIKAFSDRLAEAGYKNPETFRLDGVHLSFWERPATK